MKKIRTFDDDRFVRMTLLCLMAMFFLLTACDQTIVDERTPTEPPSAPPPPSEPEPDPIPDQVVSVEFVAPYDDGLIPVRIANNLDAVDTALYEFYDGDLLLQETTEKEPVFSLVDLGLRTLDERCRTFLIDLEVTLKDGYQLLSDPESVLVRVGELEPDCSIPEPRAGFDFDVTECEAEFLDTSTGGDLDYDWTFGDGNSRSTERDPTHLYPSPGQYDVKLIVIDRDTGLQDSAEAEVIVGADCIP